MFKIRHVLVLAMVAALVFGAGEAAAQQSAKPESVLTRIPGDCLGFVVINNLGDATAKVDKFIVDIGFGGMLPSSILKVTKAQLRVGDGFVDNGGVAVVVLDLAQYGWDVKKMIEAERGPDSPPPVALLLPGGDPMKMFAAYKPEKTDGYVKVTLPGWPGFAKALGGYTVISPMPQVVDAVLASRVPVAAKLGKDHARIIAGCDVAAYGDMKMIAPYINAGIDKMDKEMARDGGIAANRGRDVSSEVMMMGLVRGLLPTYKKIIGQMDGVTLGLRLTRKGLVLEEVATYLPESDLGRIIAGTKARPGTMMKNISMLPYVVAGGVAAQTTTPEAKALGEKLGQSIVDAILGSGLGGEIPAELAARALKIGKTMESQIVRGDFYAGGTTEAGGLFGLGVMLKVKDPAVVKSALGELVVLSEDAIKHFFAGEGRDKEEVRQLSFRYVKGAATVGGKTLDAIEITHPEMASMSDRERREMRKVLGEDKVRFFIATPDARTVTITFGGATAFAGAVATAQTVQTFAVDQVVAAAMKELPANPAFAMLISPANLLEVVKAGIRIMGGDEILAETGLGDVTMKSKAPIAIGAALLRSGVHERAFVPTKTVAEAVKIGMGLWQQSTGLRRANSDRTQASEFRQDDARDNDF